MVSLIISEMYREVANNCGITHQSLRKTFPRECFTEVCNAIFELSELNTNPHINCEVNLHRRVCSVKFTYFKDVGEATPFEKKVKNEFEELGII